METGFKRNLLAELLDSVGRGVLLMALGIGWFVFLWGLNLPALLAGIALGTLLLLLRRLYRQTTLARRETALRCRIGGELLLEKMLLSEAKEAHFQAALLLEEKWPLRMQRITADGALCGQESRRAARKRCWCSAFGCRRKGSCPSGSWWRHTGRCSGSRRIESSCACWEKRRRG